MSDDKTDWIEPAEAIRILVRAALPERLDIADVADKIDFGAPMSMTQFYGITADQFEAANRARDLFHEKRRSQEVDASGVFNGEGSRILIEPSEFSRGHFNIRNRTLDCTIPGHPKRVWRDVLVSKREVETLARTLGGRGKTECSREAYRTHWGDVIDKKKVWPSGKDDDTWAKQNYYSTGSVRKRRREHIGNLPADKRKHIRKGGPRRPFPEPGRNF